MKEKYLPQIEKADGAKKAELQKKYKAELVKAKRTRLTTQIQMIFQDPIASLDPRMTVREIIAEGLIIQGEKDQEAINKKVYEMLNSFKINISRSNIVQFNNRASSRCLAAAGLAYQPKHFRSKKGGASKEI